MLDFQDFLLLKMKPSVWGLREIMIFQRGNQMVMTGVTHL